VLAGIAAIAVKQENRYHEISHTRKETMDRRILMLCEHRRMSCYETQLSNLNETLWS
jgi:hypothetical protein